MSESVIVILLKIKNGGRGGIRTHGPFRAYSFQDCRNRPLYHSSINFGAPARSRTGRYSNTPFERAAFTYLATGALFGAPGRIRTCTIPSSRGIAEV
jgi:hypothetical protein